MIESGAESWEKMDKLWREIASLPHPALILTSHHVYTMYSHTLRFGYYVLKWNRKTAKHRRLNFR